MEFKTWELVAVMLIRAKYCKDEPVKYISHLDLVRTINRGVRRAKIPIAFSGGFNPQPKISYGSALPVGVKGLGEYADFELEKPISPAEFKVMLNSKLPEGIRILEARQVPAGVSSLMSVINAAVYDALLVFDEPVEPEWLTRKFKYFLFRDSIIVEKVKHKKGKQRIKQFNIKPHVFNLKCLESRACAAKIRMTVGTGERGNVTPDMILEGLKRYEHIPRGWSLEDVCRLGLFVKVKDRLISPLDYLK